MDFSCLLCMQYLKLPREFLFFSEESSGEFLRWGICTCKQFSRFVYTDAQAGWDCEGIAGSLTSGFPIGVKAPCWHTILLCKV